MTQIETAEESQACRAAMARLAECGWSLEDEDDNFALVRMWIAGREYATTCARLTPPSDEITAAAERLLKRHREYEDSDGGDGQPIEYFVACEVDDDADWPCDTALVARFALAAAAQFAEPAPR